MMKPWSVCVVLQYYHKRGTSHAETRLRYNTQRTETTFPFACLFFRHVFPHRDESELPNESRSVSTDSESAALPPVCSQTMTVMLRSWCIYRRPWLTNYWHGRDFPTAARRTRLRLWIGEGEFVDLVHTCACGWTFLQKYSRRLCHTKSTTDRKQRQWMRRKCPLENYWLVCSNQKIDLERIEKPFVNCKQTSFQEMGCV